MDSVCLFSLANKLAASPILSWKPATANRHSSAPCGSPSKPDFARQAKCPMTAVLQETKHCSLPLQTSTVPHHPATHYPGFLDIIRKHNRRKELVHANESARRGRQAAENFVPHQAA